MSLFHQPVKAMEVMVLDAEPCRAQVLEHKLSEDLRRLLVYDDLKPLTLGQVFSAMGDRSFGLALMVTSLPSALPLPAPGYSTPFGVLLVLLSLQMLLRYPTPWLPNWAAKIVIPPKLAQAMLGGASRFLARMEKWVRPRWSLMSDRMGHVLASGVVFFMGSLMILPIPGTNTAPAGVIFLMSIGLIEEDGVVVSFATVLGVLAVVFYSVILWMIFSLGVGGVSEAINILRGL